MKLIDRLNAWERKHWRELERLLVAILGFVIALLAIAEILAGW